jgi:prevent-host-death family protein
MDTVMGATEARKRFFEIIDWASKTGGEIVVEKEGKPAVVISSVKPIKTKREIKAITNRFIKTFSRYPYRSSPFDTKEWQKKEKNYLDNLAKGILS